MKYNLVLTTILLFVCSWTFSESYGIVLHNTAEFKKEKKNELSRTSLNVNPGDIVKIIAPGYSGDATHIQLIKNYVESLGLVPNVAENIYNQSEPFYSNWDEFRANDLISALLDDSVKIIWCIRGGSGSMRLIPYLEEFLPATLNHKIFIGFSDITVLHLYFQRRYGWQTLHGPMLGGIVSGQYNQTGESVVSLLNLIFERQESICLPLLKKLNENPYVAGIESTVVGGNVALVEASIGTSWQVNAEEKILFLEDVGEAPYSIERSLDHMKQSGIFNFVDAVIFGDFTGTDNDLMDLVLKRFAESVSIAVFRVAGIGHANVNYPLPLLTHTRISQNDSETYNFCVDNIKNVTNINSSSYRTTSSNLLLLLIVGSMFLVFCL